MNDVYLEKQREIDLGEVPAGSVFHLVGVGGAGMSAIATVLIEMGFKIEGSDLKESSYVRRLRDMGAVVGLGHRAENVSECRAVVQSSAIRRDNPEMVEASRRGIPIVSRASMLASIMNTRRGIAVAGTHGKTTTSSLIACMLAGCGEDPSYLIGGELNEIGGNAHYGSGKLLVAEADESDGSLLLLRPEIAVLTNIDWDHLDFFDSPEHTENVFRDFLDVLPLDGYAVICGDDKRARGVGEDFARCGGDAYFYGSGENNDYRFEVLQADVGGSTFEVLFEGEPLCAATIRLPGIHNVYNALGALAVGHRLGLPLEGLSSGIAGCRGVRRRFDSVGERGGIEVIDDYAHHPTEVKAVLDMAGDVTDARVVAVFQPHRYTRTRMLAAEFGQSFGGADLVIVTDVYGAGEDPEPGVTGRLIVDSIVESDPGKRVEYFAARAELAVKVASLLEPGDKVITMGAGDITQCAREILELLPDGEG
ncbi:MAG: UDP-N-acetylmuramate--L-alanine ligase [Candidatus Geothermincolia bacterium]